MFHKPMLDVSGAQEGNDERRHLICGGSRWRDDDERRPSTYERLTQLRWNTCWPRRITCMTFVITTTWWFRVGLEKRNSSNNALLNDQSRSTKCLSVSLSALDIFTYHFLDFIFIFIEQETVERFGSIVEYRSMSRHSRRRRWHRLQRATCSSVGRVCL